VLASSVLDNGFESQSGQTEDCEFCIWCISRALRRKSKDPYNLIFTIKFNDSSILITIISCDYLNLSLANEHVGDVTIPGGLVNQIEIFKLNYIYIYIYKHLDYMYISFTKPRMTGQKIGMWLQELFI
jgi:hypothetical protein